MKNIAPYLITFIVSVLSALLIQFKLTPNNFKYFDTKATIDSYQNSLVSKGATQQEQIQLLSRFVDVMNDVTFSYSKDNNVVIIVSAAHVAGAEDITKIIQQKIIEKYKGE